MKRATRSPVVFLISVLMAITVQSRATLDQDKASVQALPVQERETADRKGMDIYLSYDSLGNLTKVTVKSNQSDKNQIQLLLNRESVVATLEELMPEDKRGNKIRQGDGSSFGRAYGETIVYERAQIDLTLVCKENSCGVTYAEMRLKD
ncbi:MAG: hypothetical protein ACRD9S_05500 [Pyrinomonadaceae bacterium]